MNSDNILSTYIDYYAVIKPTFKAIFYIILKIRPEISTNKFKLYLLCRLLKETRQRRIQGFELIKLLLTLRIRRDRPEQKCRPRTDATERYI